MSKSERKSVLPSEPSHGYEFGGPIGAFATSFGLPLVCYLATFLCNDVSGCPVPSALHPSKLTITKLKEETGWPENGVLGLASFKVTRYVLGYYFLSLVFQAFLPGQESEGVKLSSGGRLKYKFNAFNSAVVTLVVALAGTALQGPDFPLWTFIWENYTQLITTNLGIAFSLACFVYVRSFSVKAGNPDRRELAAGGHSGNLVYDWFIGRELNPRIDLPIFGNIDIKAFCELRPGMLGWVLLDLAFMMHQYKLYGFVSDSMILITTFQSLYVFDALWMEPAILTTMDITTDGFGFMLAFGDLAWLPFIYSLQARYLAVYPVHLGLSGILGVLAVQGFGYYIFRGANNEKNRFRTDPNDPKIAHLQYMETASGSKLLTSGWWGTARHINYLGDWIMAWSYCLPTGIAGYLVQHSSPAPINGAQSPTDGGIVGGVPLKTEFVQGEARGWGMLVTYFYVIYFAILLIHREMRDEEKCLRKYGKDWETYRKKVPYRILPYVY
ncbi:erg24, C-14 sterol reductase [Loxospora ochrophaea]|nr:erg24, C-14 sterol reductase [Loxospora ochrophaea]